MEYPLISYANEAFVKVDPKTLQTTRTTTITEILHYDYDLLVKQRDTIQAQKDRDSAQRDMELEEVNELIKQCDSLGISLVGEKV